MLKFLTDHRASNPDLHDLYVMYAAEKIGSILNFIDTMKGYGHVDAILFANDVRDRLDKLCIEDAAWAEALLRHHTGNPIEYRPFVPVKSIEPEPAEPFEPTVLDVPDIVLVPKYHDDDHPL